MVCLQRARSSNPRLRLHKRSAHAVQRAVHVQSEKSGQDLSSSPYPGAEERSGPGGRHGTNRMRNGMKHTTARSASQPGRRDAIAPSSGQSASVTVCRVPRRKGRNGRLGADGRSGLRGRGRRAGASGATTPGPGKDTAAAWARTRGTSILTHSASCGAGLCTGARFGGGAWSEWV